jgi:hypothetical protein
MNPSKLSMKTALTDPDAADKVVVTAHRAAICPYPSALIASMLPWLNPYHPNQRRKIPRT